MGNYAVNIPTFVQEKPLDENGNWSKPWQQLWEQLLQNMQQSISDEGFLIPSQTTANIAVIIAINPETGTPFMSPGTIIYDSTTDEFKGMVGTTLKTFTLV